MLSEFFVVNIPPIPASDDFQILVPADDYSPDEIVIFKIDLNYYFPEYDEESNNYIYTLPRNSGFVNLDANTIVTTILYNYNKEEIIDARKGDVVLNQILDYEIVFTTSCLVTDSSLWRNGALVKSVEGPFQEDKRVEKIDLKKPVYYLAVPNTNDVSDSQLLSIKWEYQYNDGEFNSFKNSKRSVVEEDGQKKCKIECLFHDRSDIDSIQMFAFFSKRSDKVVSKTIINEPQESASKCLITLSEIESMFGVISKQKDFRQLIVDYLNKYIYRSGKEIHIDTPIRKRHFFAQVGAETLGINKSWMVETDVFKFRVKSAKAAFGQRARNLEAQGLLAEYCAERPQKKLLNYMYAAENGFGNGNGDEQSGEGYKYRGRGLKQLTGKENYKNAQNFIKKVFGITVDFVKDPDLVAQPQYAVLSAIAYWEYHEIWKLADKFIAPTGSEFKKIRRAVNGGLKGLNDAIGYFNDGDVFEKNCSQAKLSSSKGISNEEENEVGESDGKWHDPVDNPRLNKYNYGGAVKPVSAVYGHGRRKSDGSKKYHSGVDLFGIPGKDKVYACLDCVLQEVRFSNQAGWIVRIKVNNIADLLEQEKKINYTPAYKDELKGINLTKDDDAYLIYMHLQKVFFTAEDAKKKKQLPAGTALGYVGVSGSIASGGRAPHLHFEVSKVLNPYGTGQKNRTNGARFVKLNSYDTKDQDEASKTKHYHKK